MENKILAAFILTFLITSTISASAQATVTNSNSSLPIINKNDPTPKLDEKVEREITIPEGLQLLARGFLGIDPEKTIKVSTLITIIALWILFFIIFISGLQSVQILGQTSRIIVAAGITTLIASTKALSIAAEKWLVNREFLIFIQGWSFGNLVINILAIILVIVAVLYFRERIKKDIKEDKKEKMLDKIRTFFINLRSN